MDMAQPTDNCLLYEIVRLIDIAGERDRECPQVRKSFEEIGTEIGRKGGSGLERHMTFLRGQKHILGRQRPTISDRP